MTHVHGWSRWIRGRRTGQWFRFCSSCGVHERSDEKGEDYVKARGMPDTHDDSESYSEAELDIRGTMETFQRRAMAQQVRNNIVDFRQKRAGQ